MTKEGGQWSVQDARARFDELLEACVGLGPQIIVDEGREFVLTIAGVKSEPKGKALLLKGGPLDGGD